MNKKIAIIMPAYNEERKIEKTLNSLVKAHSDHAEIIVVNDGSTDGTVDIVTKFPDVKIVSHKANYGYGAALKTGVLETDKDVICFFDADGQHDAEDLNRLIAEIDDADMIIGSRGKRAYTSKIVRAPGKYVLKILSSYLAGRNIPDLNSGIRVIKRNVLLRYIHLLPDGFSASSTMTMVFLVRKYDVKFMPVAIKKRIGKSQVNMAYDGVQTIMLLVRIMMLFNPLRIFFPFSTFCIVVGVLYGMERMFFGPSTGFPVGALLAVIVGLFAFMLGLLADQTATIRYERFEEIEAIKRFKKSE